MMLRVAAVVLWSDGQIVQTRQFHITNAIGGAEHVVKRLYEWGVDEIVLLDITRGRDRQAPAFVADVARCREVCAVPLLVGGKVRLMDDAARLFDNGADMIVVNTSAQDDWGFVEGMAVRWGCQAVTVSIDWGDGRTSYHVTEAAGQVLMNNVLHDGMGDGYDLVGLRVLMSRARCPVIIMGGAWKPEHFVEGARAGASAVAAGNLFHQREHAVGMVKKALRRAGFAVRLDEVERPKVRRVFA